MAMVIYDNGGKTVDRYTVFPWAHSKVLTERRTYLGMAEGGRGFSQWGELPAETPRGRHLGKIVKFEDLDKASQDHINARLAEGDQQSAQVEPVAPEAKPAPAKAQASMIPEEDKTPYLRSLQAQRKALRLKHGIKRQGGEVCQWQTSRRLRPQVAKQLAKLDALIQVATRGWHESRATLETTVSYSGRPYSYSTAKLYKQGKYGHNLLGS